MTPCFQFREKGSEITVCCCWGLLGSPGHLTHMGRTNMGLFTIHQRELGQKKPSSSLLHRANWRWLATCPLPSVSPTAAPWQSQRRAGTDTYQEPWQHPGCSFDPHQKAEKDLPGVRSLGDHHVHVIMKFFFRTTHPCTTSIPSG